MSVEAQVNPAPAEGATGNVAPEVEGQQTPTPEPTPVSLKDDDIVEVLVDGQPVRKPWKEARGGIMRQEDYTRKTQAGAEERRRLGELYEQVKARQEVIAQKEAAIDAILGRTPNVPQPNQLPDDEVITAGQMRQILAEHARTLRGEVDSRVEQSSAQAEETRQFQRWEDKTTETVGALVKEHPFLEDVPNLDLVLKREALKEKPQSEADMFQAILRAGKSLADKLEKRFQERQKELSLKKSKLTQNGPEPKGGTTQFTSKKTYGTGRVVDWQDIERDVISAISAIED